MPHVKFIVIIEASFIVESPLQPIALHGPNLTRTPFSKSRQMICAQKISIICTHASQFTGSFTWQSDNFHNLIQVKRNKKTGSTGSTLFKNHCPTWIPRLAGRIFYRNWSGPPNHPSMSQMEWKLVASLSGNKWSSIWSWQLLKNFGMVCYQCVGPCILLGHGFNDGINILLTSEVKWEWRWCDGETTGSVGVLLGKLLTHPFVHSIISQIFRELDQMIRHCIWVCNAFILTLAFHVFPGRRRNSCNFFNLSR